MLSPADRWHDVTCATDSYDVEMNDRGHHRHRPRVLSIGDQDEELSGARFTHPWRWGLPPDRQQEQK